LNGGPDTITSDPSPIGPDRCLGIAAGNANIFCKNYLFLMEINQYYAVEAKAVSYLYYQ
jgi:hypothetical protein